jgi:hypothetical protein
MTTLDTDGFLSPDIEGYVEECQARYKEWFQVVRSINQLSQSILHEVNIDPIDLQQYLAGLLYIRVLSHAQGAVLLIEHCMSTQAEVLCRASLEALFALLAVIEKRDTAHFLVKGDRHHQRDLLKATLKTYENISVEERQKVCALLQGINEDLERDPSPKINTRCLAQWGGLIALYDSAYKFLSLPAHSNLRDLERQLSLDKDGNPTSISWGPNLDGLDHLLLIVADTLIRAATAMCSFSRFDHQAELQAIRSSYAVQASSVIKTI